MIELFVIAAGVAFFALMSGWQTTPVSTSDERPTREVMANRDRGLGCLILGGAGVILLVLMGGLAL